MQNSNNKYEEQNIISDKGNKNDKKILPFLPSELKREKQIIKLDT